MLVSRGLFLEKQNAYHKRKSGICDLLYIDQHISKERKTRLKNVATIWIDNQKANDMFPHSWIIECLKMYQVSDKIINFITEAMKKTEVKNQSDFFQGDVLSAFYL